MLVRPRHARRGDLTPSPGATHLAALEPRLQRLLAAARDLLAGFYGPRLQAVYLYGSYARGEQRPGDSDVDVAVVLDDFERGYEESDRIIELLHPLYLEADVLISCRPVRARDLQAGREALHRAIKREGVAI